MVGTRTGEKNGTPKPATAGKAKQPPRNTKPRKKDAAKQGDTQETEPSREPADLASQKSIRGDEQPQQPSKAEIETRSSNLNSLRETLRKNRNEVHEFATSSKLLIRLLDTIMEVRSLIDKLSANVEMLDSGAKDSPSVVRLLAIQEQEEACNHVSAVAGGKSELSKEAREKLKVFWRGLSDVGPPNWGKREVVESGGYLWGRSERAPVVGEERKEELLDKPPTKESVDEDFYDYAQVLQGFIHDLNRSITFLEGVNSTSKQVLAVIKADGEVLKHRETLSEALSDMEKKRFKEDAKGDFIRNPHGMINEADFSHDLAVERLSELQRRLKKKKEEDRLSPEAREKLDEFLSEYRVSPVSPPS